MRAKPVIVAVEAHGVPTKESFCMIHHLLVGHIRDGVDGSGKAIGALGHWDKRGMEALRNKR